MAVTILVLLALGGAADEFVEQLARLGAPTADERAAAERWLGAHMELERYPEVARAALAGDAEVRGRLARVLSSDSRHLALALELCAEEDPDLLALGRDAVRASVARSAPLLCEYGLRGEGVEHVLRRAASAGPARNLRLASHLSLEQMVEALELAGDLPIGLAVDSSAAGRTLRRREELPSAPWNELVGSLRAMGVELEFHGLARTRTLEVPAGAFVRLTAEPGPIRTGLELVCDWLFTLARDGDETTRARAARNLASCGFAPGVGWMDLRVRARADRAAREGLLRAAAHGGVAPVLLAPQVLEPLLAEAEEQGGPRSSAILCALARIGCYDEGGVALVPRLLAGFDHALPRARWTRLFLLERTGCSAALEPQLRALLVDPGTPAALRLQALHTLAAQGGPERRAPLAVEGLPALFRLELDEHAVERLGRVLELLGVPPPHRDPSTIPADWPGSARLALLQAWLLSGEPEAAAAHVVAWLASAHGESEQGIAALERELAPWRVRGSGPELDGALRTAQALAPDLARGLGRLRLLLGLVPATEVPRILARGDYGLTGTHLDLPLLGALGGYPVAIVSESAARETLQSQLAAALKESRRPEECGALIAALERAARGLFGGGRDELGHAFSNSVRYALRRNERTPLARAFLPRGSWPCPPLGPELDLARLLARFEVPSSL